MGSHTRKRLIVVLAVVVAAAAAFLLWLGMRPRPEILASGNGRIEGAGCAVGGFRRNGRR